MRQNPTPLSKKDWKARIARRTAEIKAVSETFDRLVGTEDLMRIFGLTRATVKRLREDGAFKTVMVLKRPMYPLSSVKAWFDGGGCGDVRDSDEG